MSFWATVLAVFVGVIMWDIFAAVVKVGIPLIVDKLKERKERNERKIGFDRAENSEKPAKGAQMRKIGFGAND